MEMAVAKYQTMVPGDPTLLQRSMLLSQVREFYGVRYAALYPKFREMDDALANVRRVIATVRD